MDCRKSLFLAVGLFAGCAGCSALLSTRDAGTQAAGNSDATPHKAATYAAFADYRLSASFTQGLCPEVQQQYREEAERGYLKAVEVDPKFMGAYVGLAKVRETNGDHAGAAAIYEGALRQDPKDARLWFELGMCQGRAKNWDAAVQGLRKACDLDPSNRIYGTTLGFTLARAGLYNDSFAVLAKHLGEPAAHSDLARMLHHLNQPELARQQAVLALSKDPSQSAARSLLAALDGGAKPGTSLTGQQQAIQTVAYNEPAAQPRPMPDVPASPMPEQDSAAWSIHVPPPPVISIHTRSE
jgi:tetratricopeptide (TPR) repeat protein